MARKAKRKSIPARSKEHEIPTKSEIPPPLSPEEAKRKILLILRDGDFIPTYHCRKESMVNRGVSDQDVLHVLQHGEIISKPGWDENHHNWKYRVEGVDLQEDELTAITVIIEKSLRLIIITVF